MDNKIFVSYSRADGLIVDSIDNYLKNIGITLKRDIRDIDYTQSIKAFMKTVRTSEYVLIVISDTYLKSHNCMYEILEFIKDENFKERILPIVLEDANVFGFDAGLEYIEYWEKKYKEFDNALNLYDRKNIGKKIDELKKVEEISRNICEFISVINEINCIGECELKERDLEKGAYFKILKKIGYDKKILNERVVIISNINDDEEKEINLDEFLKENPNNISANILKAKMETKKKD